VPLTAVYLWLFWRYLRGDGPPDSTSIERRTSLRANNISRRLWSWALLAGGLGIVALVLALNLANRLIVLPQQAVPDLTNVPKATILALLIFAAPVAGVIEEAAFRGYMQRPIERRSGLAVAILVTGTMFALAHLDFTLVLWPYYVAVAAIYGTVTSLTDSILPAIVLHTGGNIYSNLDLWLHGQAEWQAGAAPGGLIWQTGIDEPFRNASIALLVVATMMMWAYRKLAEAAQLDRVS
jgi:membrane protease YdiL (CAAX protease family)